MDVSIRQAAEAAKPAVRLAWFDIPAVDKALAPAVRLAQNGPDTPPALLVSYYYLEPFLKSQPLYRYRDWVMDSGAFSAHNSGAKIELNAYIDKCLELLASDPTLTEVFALDEIPKSQSTHDIAAAVDRSIRNTEEMWRQGVPAIPCFHRGEPEDALLHIARQYPKIAFGGMVGAGDDAKEAFIEQCFARVWPKRVHGFGVSSERLVYGFPFHSVDATNWELAPCAFGNWMKFGHLSVRGSNQDLRSQVKYYLDLEAKARVRWARQMAQLDALPPSPAKAGQPAQRSAVAGPSASGDAPPAKPPPPAQKQPPAAKPAKPAAKTSAQLGELDDRWANWRPS